MVELPLTNADEIALVDKAFAYLAKLEWRLGTNGYVVCCSRPYLYLHHVILPQKKFPAFARRHLNRDRLDNRKSNLVWVKRHRNDKRTTAFTVQPRRQLQFRNQSNT
jgi:hypothetical protein